MIRWCSYCQTYQGEVAPYDRFDLTHGICAACAERNAMAGGDPVARIQPIVDFHARLRKEARGGFVTGPHEIFEMGVALGIQPVDLLIGLLQPALYEIGELWARGEVTVAAEHRFSTMVDNLTTLVLDRLSHDRGPRPVEAPDYLLVNADGNYHTLGTRIVQLLLQSCDRTTVVILPGLPSREVLELARSLRPRTLGVSISRPAQIRGLREISAGLAERPEGERPRLVVGGLPIKAGLQLDPALGAEAVPDPRTLIATPGRTTGAERT